MLDAVPFEYARQDVPLLVVEARIGEDARPLHVVIDSGGGGPVGIYLAQALGDLPGMNLGPPAPMPTPFGGTPVTLRTGTIARITIGGVTLADAAVGQSNLVDNLATRLGAPVDAIAGHHFLASRVVAIDYPARQIDFTAPRGPAEEGVPIRPTPEGRHMLISASVNGAGPYSFLIDTGSMNSHVSAAVARQARMRRSGYSIMHSAGGTMRVPTSPARIAAGGRSIALPRVLMSVGLDDVSQRSGTRIDGILGVDWLSAQRITIDYPGQRMWLGPMSATTAAAHESAGLQ